MNRNEAVLRELNLYPLWVRRNTPAAKMVELGSEDARADISITNRNQENEVAAKQLPATSPDTSTLDWPQLKAQVRDCEACKLRAGCSQTVFGVGDEKAEWLFVGEGPGADEDAQGEPFVGQAGKLLDNMLAAIKLKRGSNVYIANIVKCRPPGNRTPEPDEIATCLPYLRRQIELLQPRLIIALGKTAATALLGKEATLGSLRGAVHDYQVSTATVLEGDQGYESSRRQPFPHQTTSSHRVGASIPLIVTYHPAYLLRSPTEKAKAWQDLCLAVEIKSKK